MREDTIVERKQFHATNLLSNIVPFWLEHGLDTEHGGFHGYLDRDGSLYGTDKSVWAQGRGVWVFSRLCDVLGVREEWLETARSGFEFLMDHCFDDDGRMFFWVTGDGKPLRKRRYFFTETFGAIGCAGYARLSGSERAFERAQETYRLVVDLYHHPEKLPPKVNPETRRTKAHAVPMIVLATSQVMRTMQEDPLYEEIIDETLEELFRDFVKPSERALFETVGPDGERLDSPRGRCLNPGHAIETSWFLMEEGRHRSDQGLVEKALQILEWSLERGWDEEYGGLYYFVDVESRPPEQLEWDMKLWWPHTEALYALLLAHSLTGEKKYEAWYDRVHTWTADHFLDPEHGEWFGYLHRTGTISHRLKGNLWKGPFHIPRALLNCWRVLEEMEEEREGG